MRNPAPSVLLVEDEPITRTVTARYLHQAGFVVHMAENGEEALGLLRRKDLSVDWLLTDINLPGIIDGWIVGAEFHLTHPLRPVIYASAFAAPVTARPSGGVFVSKPYSAATIVDVIEKLSAGDDLDDPRPFADRFAELFASTSEPA
jgi:two-component system OmpR family response regulator